MGHRIEGVGPAMPSTIASSVCDLRSKSLQASWDFPTKACYGNPMTVVLRLFAWLLAAAIIFATLGPPRHRPHADITHDGEHALAFILLGLAFALAYPKQRCFAASISVILIGILELLQILVPGRHARLEDFFVDAITALAGFALVAVIDWLRGSRWHEKRID
jgi:VanZ family protein